jgi:PAS domain S-box-containing protein
MSRLDFEQIFNASPNPYMLLDRHFRFVAANDAYLRVTGASREALIGQSLFDAFPNDPDDAANASAGMLRESLARVLESRAADVIALIPYRIPRLDNGHIVHEERFWSATHTPILDDHQQVEYILQHTVDVTELRRRHTPAVPGQLEAGVLARAEQLQRLNVDLDAERQHLRRLFDQAPGFICVLRGPQHVFELVNGAYSQLIGHRASLGRTVREALPEIEGQGYFEQLDAVYATGVPFVGSAMHMRLQRHADAPPEDVVLDFVYQPIFDGDGAVTGIFVQGHDITAQKQLEARLEEMLERQRFLAESIPQQVWTASISGELTFVNGRVADYFAAPPDRLLGAGWVQYLHPDDVPGTHRRWTASLTTGENYEIEFRLRRFDGVYRWHLGLAVARRDPNGAVTEWFGTNTDIDDRKRAQDSLEARSKFEHQLIGIVSHDLRNPVNAIGIAAALLRERGGLDDRQQKAVSRIVSSSERARRMIRDFLDFTQARSSGLPINREPGNMGDIARHVFEELQIIHQGRRATAQYEGELDGAWDAERMAQVIANLLGNAFQHGARDGTIDLTTRACGDDVLIEVRNDCVPIPPETLKRLFEPFQRGDRVTPSSERSLGLGLYIAKQIVAAHGGTIDVRSTGDDGTRFTVRVPKGIT